MSEDADFVVPSPPQRKRENALRMNKIRDLLQEIKPDVGVRLRFPHGNRSDQHSGCIWELPYNSPFGPQQIVLEVTLPPVLREPRQVHLRQLIPPTELNGYESAFCWALDQAEARAEKVRAALTRIPRAIRDFFDLEQLANAGFEFGSENFINLVNRKLDESQARHLKDHGQSFGLDQPTQRQLKAAIDKDLRSVVRVSEPRFDLDGMLVRFNKLWGLS